MEIELSGVPSPALSLKHLPAHTLLCPSDGLWSLKAFWHRCSHGEARHATCPHSGGSEGFPASPLLALLPPPHAPTQPRRALPARGNRCSGGQAQRRGASAPSRLVPPLQAVVAAAGPGPSAVLWGRLPAPPRPAGESHPSAARQPGGQRPGVRPAARWAGCSWAQLSRAEPSWLLPPVAFLSYCRAGFAQHPNWVATSISHGASAVQAENCRENFSSAGLT